MKKIKTMITRLLVILISFSMFFSILPIIAFAEDVLSENSINIIQKQDTETPREPEPPSEGNSADYDSTNDHQVENNETDLSNDDNLNNDQQQLENIEADLSLQMSDTGFVLDEDYTKNATELVQSLIGNEVNVTDIEAVGTVYRINNAKSMMGINSCVTLDTSGRTTSDYPDPNLNALIASEKKSYGGDTSALMFTMQATGSLLNFNYVFASTEFDQDSKYNDIFGLFVKVNDGEFENIALLDNEKHITITNLRAGRNGTQLNNGTSTAIGATGTEYDYFSVTDTLSINNGDCNGLTKIFNAKKSVNVGDMVTIKFVIADVGDKDMNSYVMIEDGSISFEEKGGMINGEITQNDNYVEGASVKLIKGNKQIADVFTSEVGKYSFPDVEPGIYTLEVTSGNKVVTVFVNVVSSPITKNIAIPNVNGAQNTIVEINNDETPNVVTDLNGLFGGTLADNKDTTKGITQADIDTITAGGNVEIKLTAEKKDETEVKGDAEKIKILANAPTAKYLFVDLSVLKTVTESDNTIKDCVKLTELNNLVNIVIQVPPELRGAGLKVFRMHEGVAQELTAIKNVDGERIELSDDYAYATITTKKFSTYAIMNVPAAYNVTLSNAAAGYSGGGNYAEGAIVNIKAGMKNGYSFNGWTSSDGITLSNANSANTTFTMPAKDVTVTAHWKSIGNSGLSSDYDSTENQYEFWVEVENKINSANHSDVISINANNYDQLPCSVMDVLRKNHVTLVINWNGGNTITIPAGKAQTNEANRILWPLTLLEQFYKNIQASNIINPETGGPGYLKEVSNGTIKNSVENVNDISPSVLSKHTAPRANDNIVITSTYEKSTMSLTNLSISDIAVIMVITIISLVIFLFVRMKKR